MFRALDPTYTFRVEFKDRLSDPGHQNLTGGGAQCLPSSPYRLYNALAGKTGCDEALAIIKEALRKAGLPCEVTLEKFEHK